MILASGPPRDHGRADDRYRRARHGTARVSRSSRLYFVRTALWGGSTTVYVHFAAINGSEGMNAAYFHGGNGAIPAWVGQVEGDIQKVGRRAKRCVVAADQ